MNLNKTIKADIAFQLTVKTHKKQAAELTKRLKSINDAFWSDHLKKCQDMTGWSVAKMKQMAELGVITRASHFRPMIRNSDGDFSTLTVINTSREDVRVKVLAAYDFTGSGDLICRGNYNTRLLYIGFKYPPQPVPMTTDMTHITNGTMVRRLKAAHVAAVKLCEDIENTHVSLVRVLSGYRTVKRLAEDFPEAAALVPAPKAPVNQMVSKDEIERVRALVQTA